MTLIEKILEELLQRTYYYKGIPVNIFGIPRLRKHSYKSLKSTVFTMRKRGLLEKCDKGWLATKAGKNYLKRKANSLQNFDFRFEKNLSKNLIVMFDIPEAKKAEREWFRWHLKKFNYVMIQKSVWVGPSPLPKEFLDYLDKIKLRSCIKTFKLAKIYNLDN